MELRREREGGGEGDESVMGIMCAPYCPLWLWPCGVSGHPLSSCQPVQVEGRPPARPFTSSICFQFTSGWVGPWDQHSPKPPLSPWGA